ncbi:MAG: Crp/Fnr family transcriptional regulator [Myxococcota bacterium]
MDAPFLAQLAQVLPRVIPASDDAVRAIAALVTRATFPRDAWLLRAGDRAEWCHLVISGLVRELYVDDDGVEHTRCFLAEGAVTGSLLDLLSSGPAVTWIQALEPTTTLRWRYADFDALCARHRDLDTFARRLAESLYVRKARREYELLALGAAARYARWCREEATLDGRVSRRHLASYLGITPEHLSRLRRAPAAPAAHVRKSRR